METGQDRFAAHRRRMVETQLAPRGITGERRLVREYHTCCAFVPLLGEYGWPDASV